MAAPAPHLDDLLYTTIGFGVLGFQRLQVARRDVTAGVKAGVTTALPAVKALVRSAERAVDPVLDRVERSVPEPGRFLLRAARTTARNLS